jgi:predicted O-linked N-acetylglucosamine transferase (SPINDLY family)
MAAVPGSRLLLKGFGLAPGRGEERLRGWLEEAGVAPERLRVAPHIRHRAEHLALYAEVDIALDPFPYNGTTTTCEALWMGVPVLALRGDRHAARVSASILHRLRLDELVAESEADFLARAVGLAADPGRLADLRAGLRQRFLASPLADAAGLARDLEAAYREMWRQHGAGLAPQPIDLPADDA